MHVIALLLVFMDIAQVATLDWDLSFYPLPSKTDLQDVLDDDDTDAFVAELYEGRSIIQMTRPVYSIICLLVVVVSHTHTSDSTTPLSTRPGPPS